MPLLEYRPVGKAREPPPTAGRWLQQTLPVPENTENEPVLPVLVVMLVQDIDPAQVAQEISQSSGFAAS